MSKRPITKAVEEKAWKRLTKESDRFHSLIGQCIAGWSYLDDEMFQAFRDCVGPSIQCAIIFYRSPGLDTRLGLTDEIIRSVLPKRERPNGGKDHPDVVRWTKIRDNIQSLLSVRRKIAHQPVHGSIMALQLPNNTYEFDLSGFEIFASRGERLRKVGSQNMSDYKVPPLTDKDLQSHMASLKEVRLELVAFRRDVRLRPPEEQPPTNVQTIRETSQGDD